MIRLPRWLWALDRLSPLEREAFLLHDVFDYSFGEIANTWKERKPRGSAACEPCAGAGERGAFACYAREPGRRNGQLSGGPAAHAE